MRLRNLLAIAATATLAFNGCSNDESGRAETVEHIAVSTNIGSLSRTTTDNKGVQSFVANDKISVYAWLGEAVAVNAEQLVVNNSVNTFDGSTWTASPQMLWRDMTSNHFFLGVYPSRAIASFTADSYTLDATAQENSDMLVALNTAGLKASNSPVALQFDHVMAKLIVNLSYRNQWGGTPVVTSVTVHAKNNAAIDYVKKTATATGENADIVLPVTTANASYSSIMVPQTGENTAIKIHIGDKDYTYTGTVQLESSKYTTVNLIVGRDAITLDKVTINDWGEGDVIEGGEAQEGGVSTSENTLRYTSTDGQIITPAADAFDAAISTNTYDAENKGVIVFSAPVTTVKASAFASCTTLESITLPTGVTSIKGYAFSGCTSLKSIVLPDGLTSISHYAFSECTSLPQITLPAKATSLGNGVFNKCSSLASITIPEGVTDMKEYSFNECTSLKSVTLPESVTSIGRYAFFKCSILEQISGTDKVRSFGESAFDVCSLLESISLSSATSISNYAFLNCVALKRITLPISLQSIGTQAFLYCSSLESVRCLNATPLTNMGISIFHANTKIYVQTESVEAYKAAEDWVAYASQIFDIATAPTE